MVIKRIWALILAGVLMFAVGCGQKTAEDSVRVEIEQISEPGTAEEVLPEEATETTEILTSGGAEQEEVTITSGTEQEEPTVTGGAEPTKNLTAIKVAYVGSVAGDILSEAQKYASYYGYCIEPMECNDYEQPNDMLEAGTADAAVYENEVFLESYNKRMDSNLVIEERLYFEPMGIFAGTISDLDNADGCKVAVMEGEVNLARSLYLLEQKGLITLKEDMLYQANLDSIVDNPHNLSIVSVDMNDYPDTAAYGLIISDFNRAMLAGINPEGALGYENRNSDLYDMFAICVVTDPGKVNGDKVKILSKILNCKEVEQFIESNFKGSVVDYR